MKFKIGGRKGGAAKLLVFYCVIIMCVAATILALGQMNTLNPGSGWDSVQSNVAMNFGYIMIFIISLFYLAENSRGKKSDSSLAGGYFSFIVMGLSIASLFRSMFDNNMIMDEWVTTFPGSIDEIMAATIIFFMLLGGIYIYKRR